MEKRSLNDLARTTLFVMILTAIGGMAFAAGLAWSISAHAATPSEAGGEITSETSTVSRTTTTRTRASRRSQTQGLISGKSATNAGTAGAKNAKSKVIYPKHTQLDFEGADIEGDIQSPGEFYFQRRTPEKFDSLVKARKNFHREMLRDVVLSK